MGVYFVKMSDDEDDFNTCPLCEEEMDLSDRNFLPCPCGYRVCDFPSLRSLAFIP